YPGALLQASNGSVSQAVAKNKNAIGYIGIGYLNEDVKPLMVDRIVGSAATTLNGIYPISRPLFMFTQGWPKGDVLNFINFVIHPEKGQKYVAESGYVPLY
ncbi:MAG: phosphate ABC transporter substrate-binding protein, partial [Pseudomonadota bacterium]